MNDKLDLKTIGLRLKDARKSCDYSIKNVSNKTSFSNNKIKEIEKGKEINAYVLKKLANLYCYRLTHFLEPHDEFEGTLIDLDKEDLNEEEIEAVLHARKILSNFIDFYEIKNNRW